MVQRAQARESNISTFVIILLQIKTRRNSLEVKYCPTDDMIEDFMTKPLQGSKFKKFRRLIIGEAQAEKDKKKKSYKRRQAVTRSNDRSVLKKI